MYVQYHFFDNIDYTRIYDSIVGLYDSIYYSSGFIAWRERSVWVVRWMCGMSLKDRKLFL